MNENDAIALYRSLWTECVEATPYHYLSENTMEQRRVRNAPTYHAKASSSPHVLAMVDDLLRRTQTHESIRSVLEIGAGTGVFTIPLAKRVPRVTVIDPSPGMLGVLRHNLKLENLSNVEIIEGSWPRSFSGKRYDLVLAANCLLAFYDLHEALSRMIQSANRALCLINPMTQRPRPHDPEFRQRLKQIDRGPDTDSLHLLLGMLGTESVYPLVRIFSTPSWSYPDVGKLHDRWAEALNLESEEEHAQLRSLLTENMRESEQGWTVPGISFHFLLWAGLTVNDNAQPRRNNGKQGGP